MSQGFMIDARPLSKAAGAEILGIDAGKLDDSVFEQILDCLHNNVVVIIRDQALTPAEQVAFTKRFGELEPHISPVYQMKEQPEIMVLSNEVVDGKLVGNPDAGSEWHSDQSYTERPCAYTILQSVHVPATGGDTAFTNMMMAYDTLSPQLKAKVARLVGVHNFSRLKNPRIKPLERLSTEYYEQYAPPDAHHPLVRTHPYTGRKALYLSPRSTIGVRDMPDAQAQPLLDQLFRHIDNPAFVYRHRWRQGDLMIWDNRIANHLATGGVSLPAIRRMHRTTVVGEVPY